MFVNYVLAFLEETLQSFPSTDVLKAIVEDRGEEEIIKQLINCFGGKGSIEEDQEKRCTDVFNTEGELLVKMIDFG